MKAKMPFRFCSRLALTLATGRKARTLRELLEGVKSAPDSVIYYHTHRFLQEHQSLVPEPANDFAYWAEEFLQDPETGERLTAVDPLRFNTLADIRAALVEALEKRLGGGESPRAAPEGREFRFLAARRYSVPTPHEAWDLRGFADALPRVSLSSLYLHLFEARLRPPHGINDFSHWFEKELGEAQLSRRVADLDLRHRTLNDLRGHVLRLIEERIGEADRAPA